MSDGNHLSEAYRAVIARVGRERAEARTDYERQTELLRGVVSEATTSGGVTLSEAAKLLGVSRQAVHQLIR